MAITTRMQFSHNLTPENWGKLKGKIIHTDGGVELTTTENINTLTLPLFLIEYKRQIGTGYRQVAFSMDAAVMQAERIGIPNSYVFFAADVDVKTSNVRYLAMEYLYEQARINPFISVVFAYAFDLGKAEVKKISLPNAAL